MNFSMGGGDNMAGPLTGRYHIGKYLSFLLKICERSTNIAKKLSQIKVKSKGGGEGNTATKSFIAGKI